MSVLRLRVAVPSTSRAQASGLRVLAIGHSEYAASRARQLLARQADVTLIHAGPGWRGVGRAALAVARHRGSVVYLVDVGQSTAVAAFLARTIGRRVIIDTGDLAYELARSVGKRTGAGLALVRLGERLALRSAHHVVVRGRGHLRYIEDTPASFIPDLPPEGLVPVSGEPVRRELNLEGDFVVGLVGSLNYSPRLELTYGWDVLEALALLPSEVAALIVGDGNGRAWLEARASELGVANRCRFVGRVPPHLVAGYVGAMDVAISTQSADSVGSVRTTGKVPLYLCCGCPVLASHVGEAATLLGPLGWTVPYSGTVDPRYPRRLAARLSEWIGDPAGTGRRSEQALALGRVAFDAAEMQDRLEHVLACESPSTT